jgi:hypothetical protein
MSQQSVRQAARRSALDAQAARRRERADRERRLEALAVPVLTALGERDRAVKDAETRQSGRGRGRAARRGGSDPRSRSRPDDQSGRTAGPAPLSTAVLRRRGTGRSPTATRPPTPVRLPGSRRRVVHSQTLLTADVAADGKRCGVGLRSGRRRGRTGTAGGTALDSLPGQVEGEPAEHPH